MRYPKKKENNSIYNSNKRKEYFYINLTKEIKTYTLENYKTLLREIMEAVQSLSESQPVAFSF